MAVDGHEARRHLTNYGACWTIINHGTEQARRQEPGQSRARQRAASAGLPMAFGGAGGRWGRSTGSLLGSVPKMSDGQNNFF